MEKNRSLFFLTQFFMLCAFAGIPLKHSATPQPAETPPDPEVKPVVPTHPGYKHLANDQLSVQFTSSKVFGMLPQAWPNGGWKRCYNTIAGGALPSTDAQKREAANLIAAYYGMAPSPENLRNAVPAEKNGTFSKRETADGYPLPWGVTAFGKNPELLTINCFMCHGGFNRQGLPDARVPNFDVDQEGFAEDLMKVANPKPPGAELVETFSAGFLQKPEAAPFIDPKANFTVYTAMEKSKEWGQPFFAENRYVSEAQKAAVMSQRARDSNRDKSKWNEAQVLLDLRQRKFVSAPIAPVGLGLKDHSFIYRVVTGKASSANVINGALQFHASGPWSGQQLRDFARDKGPLVYDWLKNLGGPPPNPHPRSASAQEGFNVFRKNLPDGHSCLNCHATDNGLKYTGMGTDPAIQASGQQFGAELPQKGIFLDLDLSPGLRAPNLQDINYRPGLLHNGSLPMAYFLPGCGTKDPDNPKYRTPPSAWRVIGPNPDPNQGGNVCAQLKQGTYNRPFPPEIETAEEIHHRGAFGRDWYDTSIPGGSPQNTYHAKLFDQLSKEERKKLCDYLLSL